MKKRGFGVGKWNGYGGKQDKGEIPRQTAARETGEESGLIVKDDDLEQVAVIRFYFEEEQIFECHVFFSYIWQGEPAETEEMRPQWFLVSDIPYKEMWIDDELWLPLVLGGEKIDADIYLNADGSVVKKFSWKKTSFV
jgi:8-oxo-dGTP pyrophosphatase MutT (NUDIX family)